MMKTIATMVLLSTFYFTAGYSQPAYEKIWTFGQNSGLDFSSGIPVPFRDSMQANEGVATQCDALGQLLFYTDKNTIWDRNHQVMPNGNNLDITDNSTSTTQGVAVVPWPGDSNRYFVFSLGCVAGCGTISYDNFGYLSYSVVDMSLNGGNGNIVGGLKNIIIDSMLAEQMIAVRGDNCDEYWLIVHRKDNTQFRVYHIDQSGINLSPIVSDAGTLGYYYTLSQGSFAYAPRTKKIASASRNVFAQPGITHTVELFDFNTTTGVVSNPQLLDSTLARQYGICFSPDETKLYYTDHHLYQFDLSLPTIAAIRASKTLISTDQNCALKIGPDAKIYVASPLVSGNMSYIDKPNLAGTACDYISGAISLLPGTSCMLGLPATMYLHSNGKDTNHSSFTHNRFLCDGKPILLKAPSSTGAFTWQDGSDMDSLQVSVPGIYWVLTTEPCGSRTDTFIVTEENLTLFLGNDTTICKGDVLTLSIPFDADSYLWQDGSTLPTYKVNKAGKYRLVINLDGCAAEDEIEIMEKNCSCEPMLPNAFSPNGDGLNDYYYPIFPANCNPYNYTLNIFNRWGERVFSTASLNRKWDGYYKGRPAETGVYMYELSYHDQQNNRRQSVKGDFTLLR